MYNVQTKWIQVDFDAGADIYEHIESELQDLQIGILGKKKLKKFK